MSKFTRLAMFASSAIFAVGMASAADISLGGPAPSDLVTSVNAESIKAIFDAAKVPAEIITNDKGYSFVKGSPAEGVIMVVFPSNCEGDSKSGKCQVMAVESGEWNMTMTPEQVNKFNNGLTFSNALVYEGSQGPVTEYTMLVGGGVSAKTISASLGNFVGEMMEFKKYALEVKGGSSSGGGFSSENNAAGLGVGAETMRSGADTEHNVSLSNEN